MREYADNLADRVNQLSILNVMLIAKNRPRFICESAGVERN